ncbi:DUF542 domain-containing protein [Pseudoalteromonas sp. T1lg75]|uniref:DUF542 domain-containing protein n=1 Tax=Pseudoalteromonas sp. T1lg75 TaxID=2077102 RepID=UPI000CF6850D|nr:DUF542 domain-containing protein [Pseudoalteromonas sp. T1lg75]
MEDYLSWPVGQIATHIPGATAILFANRVNFCCHAEVTLADALRKRGVEPHTVATQIGELAKRAQPKEIQQYTNNELIDYILSRYHQVHRQQLDELIRLSERVETVHQDHSLCPLGLAAHLHEMRSELEAHMQKEEQILFPLLASTPVNPMVSGPISVMTAEHQQHLQDIEKIYVMTNDVTLHPQACNTWTALYLGLQEFISDLNMHIHIENNTLFARV